MRALPLLLIALLVSLPLAAAEKLYKWTDENGVTHYTDDPPPDRSFETREVQAAQAAITVEQDATPEPGAENENCRRVRGNVATLEGSATVRMDLDGDGEAEPLGAEHKAQQLEIARRQVAVYCTAAPADADGADRDATDGG